jgi:5'-phosphate synthase pdxT subunit
MSSEIITHATSGKPLLVTCAGLIVASSNANDSRVKTLNLLDVSINRNAFGRQIDSLETHLSIVGLNDPFPAVFIRAPAVDSVSKNVEILAEHEGKPVAIRQDNIIGTSFHPELTSDLRIHDLAFFGTTISDSKA